MGLRMQPSCPRAGKGGVGLLLLLGGASPALPLLPCLRIWYAPSLGALGVALCSLDTARPGVATASASATLAAGRAPLPKLHSHWPSGDLGSPTLPGPHCSPVPPQCWCLTLSQALRIPAMGAWTALAAHSGSWGSCTTSTAAPRPPIMLLILCGNRARIPGPCAYSYESAGCCLAAGRGASREPREMGGVFASKGAWPASGVGAAAPPCWCRLFGPDRSFRGSPGRSPGHRGGSSGDILDMGFGQQAWLRAAQARGRWRTSHPVQPGLWGPVCSPGGWAGILPGALLGRPSASRAPPLLF